VSVVLNLVESPRSRSLRTSSGLSGSRPSLRDRPQPLRDVIILTKLSRNTIGHPKTKAVDAFHELLTHREGSNYCGDLWIARYHSFWFLAAKGESVTCRLVTCLHLGNIGERSASTLNEDSGCIRQVTVQLVGLALNHSPIRVIPCPLRCPLIMRERRDNAIDVRLVLGFGVPHEGTVGEVDSVAHVENGLPEGGYLLALTNRVSGNECDLAAVPIEELCS